MSDENQIEIPPSFMALFIEPARRKPSISRDEVAVRYALCEVMAKHADGDCQQHFFQPWHHREECFGALP